MKPLCDLLRLDGKHAVITGAAAGIGKFTALRFAEAGASLHLIDIDEKGLEKTAEEARKYGVDVNTYNVDLSNAEMINNFWNQLNVTPDILVNVAGIYPFKEFTEVSEDLLMKVLNVNLLAVFRMCQHFVKKVLASKKEGVIVNVSSIEALVHVEPNLVHYTMTKGGIISLTRAIVRDYGARGIRANVVLPGGIKTPGVMKTASKLGPKAIKIGKEFINRVPARRLGEPDEVARIILILASPVASYINGAVLAIDGGLSVT
ncbi:MAG: SDR family NAD(P)-dependent oxidoreductase [Candidatus Njordarchaeales archaeon]